MSGLFSIPLESADSIPRSFSFSLEPPSPLYYTFSISSVSILARCSDAILPHVILLFLSLFFSPSLFSLSLYLSSSFSLPPPSLSLSLPLCFFLSFSLRCLSSVSRFNEAIKRTCDFGSYAIRVCSLLIIPHLYCACISTLRSAFWCSGRL